MKSTNVRLVLINFITNIKLILINFNWTSREPSFKNPQQN